MKLLVVLLLVAVARAAVLQEREARAIQAPVLVRLVPLQAPGFRVEWKAVRSTNPLSPVLGYKVKVWHRKVTKDNDEPIGKEITTYEEEESPRCIQTETTPEEVTVPGAAANFAEYVNANPGQVYEVRVLAYTGSGYGFPSRTMRIRL